MNFNCEKSLLLNGINTVTKALPQRTTVPVTEGILIIAQGTTITMICTDLSKTIQTQFNAEIYTTGQIVVPGKFFNEIVRKMPDGTVTVQGDFSSGVTLSCMGSKISISALDDRDFPQLPAFNKSRTYKMPQGLLKQMINQTIFATAPEGFLRQILTGCLFDIEENNINIVALDTVRLAIRSAFIENTQEPMKAVIPSGTLNEVSKLLTDEDSPIEISFQTSNCLFDFGNTKVFTRLYEGEFLKYRAFIPTEMSLEITVNRAALLESIDRACLMVRETNHNNYIMFQISENKLVITSRSETGNVYEELPITGGNKELQIAFNAKFFVDCLKNMDEEQIHLSFTTNRSPCVITPVDNDKKLYLILPLKL